jgi:uncharacterized protein (TIGR02246 family)
MSSSSLDTLVRDNEEVRRLLAQYCRLLDGRQYVDFGRLFAPDGVWLLGGREHRGPAAVAAYMDQLLLDHPERRSLHMNTNVAIQVDGGTATATSDFTMFVHEGHAPWSVLTVGRYVDELARRPAGEGWRFVRRQLFP